MKQTPANKSSPSPAVAPGLRAELRSLLRPERRWHWIFIALVALVASAYWLISLLVSRGGLRSFGETILYRPDGDSQLWPLIASLSRFNFGDPTDALHYGSGVLSAPIPAVAPYALACAAFGNAGYIVADVVLACVYFLSVSLFLRMCGVGRFSSLIVGMALATGFLQTVMGALGTAFSQFIDPLGLVAAEHYFPNLLELKIYGNRVQRPMVTEIWVVLLMAGLVRLWRDPARSSLGFGAGLGVVMGMMAQGDFYSLGVLGLAFGAILARAARVLGWRRPAWLLAGVALGAASVVWFFVYQRLVEHPDVPRRLGLAPYDRSSLLFLPGYAPVLRVLVVAAVGSFLCYLAGRLVPGKPAARAGGRFAGLEPGLALFFTLLLVAAYFAQPVQVFLLGKGAQIYHYLHAVPVFYSYAMLVLVFHIARLAAPPELGQVLHRLAATPGRAGAVFLAVALNCVFLIAIEKSVRRIYEEGTVRGSSVEYEPWGKFGKDYRSNLSKLDRGLKRDPKYSNIKSFATFNLDVYVLLTAFHGKRAFNPDASLTVMSDADLEQRLCILAKIFDLDIEGFATLVQRIDINTFFLGSNKYRFASDYRFSKDDNDYNPNLFEQFVKNKHHQQWGWFLAIPKSELQRMAMRYVELQARPPNVELYPDLIILDHNEVASGLKPSTNYYHSMGTNRVFRVFGKIKH
jgi:hypothetical protein